jgi:hypothetical protein
LDPSQWGDYVDRECLHYRRYLSIHQEPELWAYTGIVNQEIDTAKALNGNRYRVSLMRRIIRLASDSDRLAL